jgi:RimJ/RimL family protein N-acetyltransferase
VSEKKINGDCYEFIGNIYIFFLDSLVVEIGYFLDTAATKSQCGD